MCCYIIVLPWNTLVLVTVLQSCILLYCLSILNLLKKIYIHIVFFNSRILGQGSGTDDWVRPPDHTSAPSIRSDSDRPRGEGSEKGAGRHQRPGGVVLPASGERRPPVWTL